MSTADGVFTDDTRTEPEIVFRRAALEVLIDVRDDIDEPLDEEELMQLEKESDRDFFRSLRAALRQREEIIPAGTEVKPCRWCKAPLYWVADPVSGFKQAVSIAETGRAPTATAEGVGFLHLVDCPQSAFRVDELPPKDGKADHSRDRAVLAIADAQRLKRAG